MEVTRVPPPMKVECLCNTHAANSKASEVGDP
jgi:hypothetical protein